jgi:hypothetical protein
VVVESMLAAARMLDGEGGADMGHTQRELGSRHLLRVPREQGDRVGMLPPTLNSPREKNLSRECIGGTMAQKLVTDRLRDQIATSSPMPTAQGPRTHSRAKTPRAQAGIQWKGRRRGRREKQADQRGDQRNFGLNELANSISSSNDSEPFACAQCTLEPSLQISQG